MNNEKRTIPFISIGSSSLLVVFLVLGIMTFAVLSFVSAKNDYEYSKKIASQKKEYYEACNLAEERLWELSSSFSKQNTIETGSYSFIIPIDSNRQLFVAYDILENEQQNPIYRVTEWKVELSESWSGKEELNLPSF